MIIVLTGPVRSGKSSMALDLALSRGGGVVLAVAGREDDAEMVRRIDAHRRARPAHVRVLEAGADPSWLERVQPDECLLLDCLGTVLANSVGGLFSDGDELISAGAETEAEAAADRLVSALLSRRGDTIVVTNETGWGVVPAFPSGRLFRDVLGRANRTLVGAGDAAWLVVAGRAIDLTNADKEVSWPLR